MFHVVDFHKAHHPKEKAVVPDIWLSTNNTLCALPPNASSKELEVLAQNRFEPGPGWQIFGISSLQTFTTYSEARKELVKSREQTSQSDEDPQRKRKKSSYLSEHPSQDSDNGHAPSPTTIFKTELLDLEENEWVPTSEVVVTPVVKEKEPSERRKKVKSVDGVTEEDISKSVAKKNRKSDCNKCTFLKDCVKVLKKQCKRLEKENCELSEEYTNLRTKYKARKTKHRNLKEQIKNDGGTIPSNLVKIGKSTLVEKDRLNLCSQANYSRFTGDLLEVVFGRELLANSSIKGIKDSPKPPLDQEPLNDVISFAAGKFGLDVRIVRAAVRQKLNTCHRTRPRP